MCLSCLLPLVPARKKTTAHFAVTVLEKCGGLQGRRDPRQWVCQSPSSNEPGNLTEIVVLVK